MLLSTVMTVLDPVLFLDRINCFTMVGRFAAHLNLLAFRSFNETRTIRDDFNELDLELNITLQALCQINKAEV